MAKSCRICLASIRDELIDEESKEWVKGVHLCSKSERDLWCAKHRMKAARYDSERVVNEHEHRGLAS